ncbi:nitroreductase [Lachnospiraceae bacterium 48-33]
MEIFETIMTRRSTRKYKRKPVQREVIEKIVEAGRFAPSGGNSQSIHFIVVTNKDVLDELAESVENQFSKMEITKGMYRSLARSVAASKAGRYRYDYDAPVLIITTNHKECRNNIADCSCALENMMLAANELNLGSCWVNQLWWLNDNDVILKHLYELGMEQSESVYGALVVGYPDTESGMPNRNILQRIGNKVTYVE